MPEPIQLPTAKNRDEKRAAAAAIARALHDYTDHVVRALVPAERIVCEDSLLVADTIVAGFVVYCGLHSNDPQHTERERAAFALVAATKRGEPIFSLAVQQAADHVALLAKTAALTLALAERASDD